MLSLNSLMDCLTESQRKAVLHRDGPILVLAGPGSGKTRVITCRVSALIESGVSPYNICAITFTNKAAEQMQQRLCRNESARGAHVSTFHSLCVRILRRYAVQAGISPDFSIYDDSDQTRCIKEAIKAAGADSTCFSPAKVLSVISGYKNDLEGPDDVQARADDYFTKSVAGIYKTYRNILAANNAMDFDDLLFRTAYLLKDCQDVREQLNNRFRYLLVDEYQDTNHAQYQIAKGLALLHRNICVTGDPDQSIYRWRGADIENILAFEKDWPDAVVVKLQENFRSTPNILELADKLISANTRRKQKVLVPTRNRGGEVDIEVCDDHDQEADMVAGKISRMIGQGATPDSIAVFYRVNSMSRAVEEAFIRRRIPYQVLRGVEFYSRKEIRDIISYLKIVANPQDSLALLRAVNTHPRGIGQKTVEKVGEYAERNRISLYEAFRQADCVQAISKGSQDKLKAFAAMIDGFRSDIEGMAAPQIERIFEETGLADYLEKAGAKEEGAAENINELIDAASVYDQNAETPSLTDYLQTIALYSDSDSYDSQGGKVWLMTLHAAKGLEFENAFIIGLEEGILPHERSFESQDELEEERRLLFVGITRAKTNLYISYARHRVVRGQFLRTTPSQFLYELGYYAQQESSSAGVGVDDFGQEDSTHVHSAPGPDGFAVNELVEHRKFGLGKIREYLNLGENSIVVVRFNSGQTKSLMIKYANLTRVGG